MSMAFGTRDLLDHNPVALGGLPRTGTKRFWTNPELKILAEHFPRSGLEACGPLLPGRTASSIYQQAAKQGLIPIRARGAPPRQRWFSTPQIDAAIARVYQGEPREGEVKQLARTLGRPRWWIGKRALKLGLKVPRFKELPWSEAELELLAGNAAKQPDTICRVLKAKGYARSPTAIAVKLKRMGHATGRNADLQHYTANHLGKLFGTDPHTITLWIKKGWLRAARRGTERTDKQGGDEHKIHWRDVRSFVIDNVAAVDFRKVDKFWLVDVLTMKHV